MNSKTWCSQGSLKVTRVHRELQGCVDPGWKPDIHKSCSISFASALGRENIVKGLWVDIRTERDHSWNIITDKADWTWDSNELAINKEQNNEKYKTSLKKHLFPTPSSFPGSTSSSPAVQGDREWGPGWLW